MTKKGKGVFKAEHWRNGKLLGTYIIPNTTTTLGINLMLGAMFHAVTPITTWYIGLIDNAGFTAVSNTDTMASHSGWAELVAYSESVRQTWVTDAASGAAIANTTVAVFTANATKSIYGFFVTSVSTKSGTTGTLWCATAFSNGVLAVISGDVIRVTYSYSLT